MTESFDDFEKKMPEKYALDILAEQASFLQDIATLIAELPSSTQAASESYSFTFLNLLLSDDFSLPQAVKDTIPNMDSLTIYLGDARIPEKANEDGIPASLSVDFYSGNDLYSLSRSGEKDSQIIELFQILPGELDPNFLQNPKFNGRPESVKVSEITKAELNALLMSIALPNSIGDYSAYTDKDLQSAEAFESLVELLSAKSYAQTEFRFYFIKDGEADIHYTKEAGQLTTFTLSYFDPKHQLPMQVEYDVGSEFHLSFYGVDNDRKRLIMPTAQEINYARSILAAELVALNVKRLNFEDEATVTDINLSDAQQRVITNEVAGLTEDFLNELGLNPPDTSA